LTSSTLVELVATLDAAGVAARGHLLAPEAGGVGHVLDGSLSPSRISSRYRFGHRHFGGGNEPEILDGVVVQVVAELGQVPVPTRASRLTM